MALLVPDGAGSPISEFKAFIRRVIGLILPNSLLNIARDAVEKHLSQRGLKQEWVISVARSRPHKPTYILLKLVALGHDSVTRTHKG